jgi:hypothetical protein
MFQKVENLCKREIGIVIMQFPVTIATNCQALTRCMNISYVVVHHQAPSLLLYFVAEIRDVLGKGKVVPVLNLLSITP